MAELFRGGGLDLMSEGPWFKSFTLRSLDLFLVVPRSTHQPCCVDSQLVILSPVGILNNTVVNNIMFSLQYLTVYLFTVSPISTSVLNTFDSF